MDIFYHNIKLGELLYTDNIIKLNIGFSYSDTFERVEGESFSYSSDSKILCDKNLNVVKIEINNVVINFNEISGLIADNILEDYENDTFIIIAENIGPFGVFYSDNIDIGIFMRSYIENNLLDLVNYAIDFISINEQEEFKLKFFNLNFEEKCRFWSGVCHSDRVLIDILIDFISDS